MFRLNLLLAEYIHTNGNAKESGKLKAIATVKDLLSQVDHDAEIIPHNNVEKLSRLLTSLKGEPLNKEERLLVEEIVKY